MYHHFDWEMLTPEDHDLALQYLGRERQPDLTIAPDGDAYLHRWYMKPRDASGAGGNLYFHIQVGDDPDRPLHDHPWDNMSVILAGGYIETIIDPASWHTPAYPREHIYSVERRPGDVIFRRATDAHHLRLLSGEHYTMTQFATGQYLRTWGFYTPEGWVPYTEFPSKEPHHVR